MKHSNDYAVQPRRNAHSIWAFPSRRGIIRDAALWPLCRYRHKAHWTGHPTRLNRDMRSRFGSAAYAMEELRAELASAFVASELGIPTDIPQHASYIANWIKPLREDKREIFRAAADAQKIADMELEFHPAYAVRAEIDLAAPAPTVRGIPAPRPAPG